MPLLDLHEDDLIGAAAATPDVAPSKQAPAFSAWRMVKGAVKAVPAGVAEAFGSTADILGAFGGVSAATGASAGGMFSTGTEDERKQTAEAAKKLREQGPDYRSEAGASFRQVAKDYMPDPLTAHGAEVAVAEFGRLATKAVIGGVTMGPVAGALVAGAEEGFTASDKLADQGVDVATRTQIGALTGAVTGLGFALPVAGKTVAGTVGLAALGGPASFIAQNAATREILQAADYTQLADQYDPFDPVGLTLSTLVPLGFGALAMRGAAQRAASAGKATPDAVAPATASPDVVDAARVQLLREAVDAHRPTPPEDFAAAQAHETAVKQAMDQMSAGQRVEVPPMPEAAGKSIADVVVARLEPVRAELDALRVLDAPRETAPAAVDAAPAAADAPAARADAAPQPAGVDLNATAQEAARILQDGQPEQLRQLVEDTVKAMAPDRPAAAPAADATARTPMQARLDAEIVGKPDALETKLPTTFDDAGKVKDSVTAREYLDTVKAEAAQETADANLLQVAANCFLMNGA